MNSAAPLRPAAGVRPRTVLVIAGLAWSLVNFRLDLMRRMRANGHTVLAAAPDFDDQNMDALRAEGIEPLTVPLHRTGLNPWHDLQTLRALRRVIRDRRPDVVLPYTMKPIVYGCLAAQGQPSVRCYPLFTGLGYAFSDPRPTGRRRMVRAVAIGLHRIATRRTRLAFCYNPAEARDLRRFRMVPARTRLVEVPGSGVDLDRHMPAPFAPGPTAFLFIARMLRSKGVEDLVAAARQLRAEGRVFRLDLVGPTDTNPDAVSQATLAAWQRDGDVVWHGETRDVRPFLRDCHVFVLPTRLREGVPRAILEAMACARAVITTDAPGCADTVRCGLDGVIVPMGDRAALAAAMRRFLDDPDLAVRMGAIGRDQVVRRHDVHAVNRLLLTQMGLEAETPALSRAEGRSWA